MNCREVLRELSAPEKFAQLQAQEQQHWQQHLAPLLARYTQNEARLQQLMMAQAKQQQQQQQQVELQDVLSGVSERLAVRGTGSSSSSMNSSSSSSRRIDGVMMDLVPAAAAARMDSAAGVTATADAIRRGQCAEQPAMHAASKL
jgi:DNA-binding helix-hairpin-helix protein with protein kinase domain